MNEFAPLLAGFSLATYVFSTFLKKNSHVILLFIVTCLGLFFSNMDIGLQNGETEILSVFALIILLVLVYSKKFTPALTTLTLFYFTPLSLVLIFAESIFDYFVALLFLWMGLFIYQKPALENSAQFKYICVAVVKSLFVLLFYLSTETTRLNLFIVKFEKLYLLSLVCFGIYSLILLSTSVRLATRESSASLFLILVLTGLWTKTILFGQKLFYELNPAILESLETQALPFLSGFLILIAVLSFFIKSQERFVQTLLFFVLLRVLVAMIFDLSFYPLHLVMLMSLSIFFSSFILLFRSADQSSYWIKFLQSLLLLNLAGAPFFLGHLSLQIALQPLMKEDLTISFWLIAFASGLMLISPLRFIRFPRVNFKSDINGQELRFSEHLIMILCVIISSYYITFQN